MLKSLTSFRFLAAFMVYLCHTVGLFNSRYNLGSMGVSFFYVLSGFILTYNYHSKFSELNKNNLKKFYVARLAKIYPVHILTIAIATPYFLSHQLYSILEIYFAFLSNLLMIHSFIPLPFGTVPYSLNPVSWSLSDECFFYILFPFIVFFTFKARLHKVTKKCLISACAFYVLILILTTLFSIFREVKMNDWFFYVFPLYRCLDFIMGIFVGLLFISKTNQKILNANVRVYSVLEICALVLFITWIFISPHVDMAFRLSIFFVPMWCFLVYIFAFQGGIISKLLANKWLVLLGEISFSFYMVHLLIINYVGLIPMGSMLNHFITFFGSLFLSIGIYFLYEEPLRNKIRFGFTKKIPKFMGNRTA